LSLPKRAPLGEIIFPPPARIATARALGSFLSQKNVTEP
jgi:hypothetical protein